MHNIYIKAIKPLCDNNLITVFEGPKAATV